MARNNSPVAGDQAALTCPWNSSRSRPLRDRNARLSMPKRNCAAARSGSGRSSRMLRQESPSPIRRVQFEQCNPAYCAAGIHRGGVVSDPGCGDCPSGRFGSERVPDRGSEGGGDSFFETENRYVHKNGTPVLVRKFVSVLPDETGGPTRLLLLVTDISEQRKAEAAVRASEERLRLFIEHAPRPSPCSTRKCVIWP